MPQGLLPFQHEVEKKPDGITAFAGLPTYLELVPNGVAPAIDKRVKIRCGDQGWTDVQTVMSLVLLNLAGGDGLSDLDILAGDEGFARILREYEGFGKSRKERRTLQKRLRKGGKRSVPSPLSVPFLVSF